MKVAVIMGSISDMPVMQEAIDILQGFDIEIEVDIVSAHRTPEKLFDFSQNAHTRGISVVIAGAGGAAHLPGMVASMSPLPVIGVPIKSSNSIDGWDSVLSILQMPGGVPMQLMLIPMEQISFINLMEPHLKRYICQAIKLCFLICRHLMIPCI